MSFAKPRFKIFLFFLLSPSILFAAVSGEDLDRHVRKIADQLRCPVCRGVPISESPSPMAADMVKVVREQIQAGKSDDEILTYFENRYGEWILLNPKPRGLNLLVWVLPGLLLLCGSAFLVFIVKKWSRASKH